MSWGVGVVVPARNEGAHLTDCLMALRAAIARLQLPANHRHIVVVADSCDDDTASIARTSLGAHGDVIEVQAGSAGAARNAGVERLLERMPTLWPERLWLATTDADTVVPADWLEHHLLCARQGAAAAAGVVTVDSFEDHAPEAARRFAAIYDGPLDEQHPHVHAANLGVRAHAYLATGGWRSVANGEEHDLWRAVRSLGLVTVSPRWLRVTTSGRRHSRVRGGFADWLVELNEPEVA